MNRSKLVRCLAGMAVFASTYALAAEKPLKVDVAKSSFTFADQLYQRHAVGNEATNLVFSPASIHLALTMTSAGAAGDTLKQMETVLALPGGDQTPPMYAMLASALIGNGKRAFDLSLSNNLWVQKDYPIQPDFSEILTKSYLATVTPLNFSGAPDASRLAINDAVAKQTKDKIKDLLPPDVITPLTRLVLTNAVYFKANWQHPFKREATSEEPFTALDGKAADTPMMHQTSRFGYFANESLQMVELPYVSRELSMLVILPKGNRLEDLAKVEQSLADLPQWAKAQQSKEVQLTIPKVKIESQLDLADDLKALGMADAFSDKADLSRMTTQEKLHIGAVVHKAFIAVDEAGTEAAAATAVVIEAKSAPMPEKAISFTANRPFLFAIRHNQSGAILFLGRVAKP